MVGVCLIRKIRCLLQEDWQVRIRHIYKESNRVSDTLECTLDGIIFMDNPTFQIEQLCIVDAIGVSTPRVISA